MLTLVNIGLLAIPLVSALTIPTHYLSERDSQCGVHGYDLSSSGGTQAYFYEASDALSTQPACGSRCKAEDKCQSYSVGGGVCMLYTVAVTGNLNPIADSPNAYYDRSCQVTSICGVPGYDLNTPTASVSSTAASALSVSGCSALCKADTSCLSFASSCDVCYLYYAAAAGNVNAVSSSPYFFYDVGCSVSAATSACLVSSSSSVASSTSSASLSSSTVASTSISSSSSSPSPTPTPSSSASPTPTPSSSVSPTPTPSSSASPTPTPSSSASPTPTPSSSASPTPTPSSSPISSSAPIVSSTSSAPTGCPSTSNFKIAVTGNGRTLGNSKLQQVVSVGMNGWNPGATYVAAGDATASLFTFDTTGALVMTSDPTSKVAADTGVYGPIWFGTAMQVAQRSASGNPGAFANCVRDKTVTPNQILCSQAGRTVTRLMRCGGWIYITATTPASSCYVVTLTVAEEVCT